MTNLRRFFTRAVFLAILCLPVVSYAQPIGVDGRAYGTVQADGLHVHFELYNEPWAFAYWYPAAVATIEVYHRPIVGPDCGEWQLISAPIAFSVAPASPYMTFDLFDPLAQPGNAYAYMARALDVTQRPAGLYDASLGMATYGTALLAHGSLYTGPGGCGLSSVNGINFCTNESCFSFNAIPPASYTFGSLSPALAPYINTGTVFYLYGEITAYNDICGNNEAMASLTSGTPGECTVATESRTWGYVKSLYR